MVRYNSRRNCPPGVICLTPGLIFGGCFFLAIIAGIIWYIHNTQPVFIQHHEPARSVQNVNIDTDSRYKIAPRPERQWVAEYEIPRAVIGIPTQGLPETYQSMGIVKTTGGQMLPLYGRRTASKSSRFQYYTRTDTANPIPLPIQRKDCQDDIGCDELYSGETVRVIPTGEEGHVTIYRYNGPSYIPGIF